MADEVKSVEARVLVGHQIDGKHHKPNAIYAGTPAAVKALEKEGVVDSTPAAVAYAKAQNAIDAAAKA